jgi:putative peptidoglycan lipid II flippase
MTAGTVLSRVTGLVRLAAIAGALGIAESRLPDTYNLANVAPNIIYELILGGVLTSVFVPVFVELLEKEGRERAWEVGSAIINLSLVVLIAITTLGILAAPAIAGFYAGRVDTSQAVAQQEVLTFLLRLFIPQIIFYGLTAITAGLLNAHKRFGPPMYTPVLNNLVVIGVFIFFYLSFGAVTLEEISTQQQLVIGLGTTAGVAIMALAQLPFLRGLGRYRFTLSIRHPSVKKLARLAIFVMGYVAVNQIGYLFVQWLAAAQQGGFSAYVGAFTFFLLPHGLFAVSIITALLPGMSQHAVNARWHEFRQQLSAGIRATLLLILPAAIGYFILGERIIDFLLERGVMTERSTELVTNVLRFFVVGLVPFSLFQLFLRAFYAMQDTKTPFLINTASVGLNVAVNIPLFAWLGVKGLAAGHAISYVFGAALLGRSLSNRIGSFNSPDLVHAVTRICLAAVGMGACVWLSAAATARLIGGPTLWSETLRLVLPVTVGVIAYVALAIMLGVKDLNVVKDLIVNRFKPRKVEGR